MSLSGSIGGYPGNSHTVHSGFALAVCGKSCKYAGGAGVGPGVGIGFAHPVKSQSDADSKNVITNPLCIRQLRHMAYSPSELR